MLGAENYDFTTAFGGRNAVFIGIKVAPDANVLEVAKRVRNVFPSIQAEMPNGVTGEIVYDSTKFIQSSIDEVVKTLLQTLAIVSVVIFLFLGSLRAVAIPLIAMPLSLIGAFFAMLVLGYSINLLTLLALVLAIGLVVDDAIIVVENVDRHMKVEGKPPLEAALVAARELGGPIIAMTIVLVAVYIPIGFQGGLTGALFTEFAFTLAGAVAVSGIVALTLSPMMTSRIFRKEQEGGRFVQHIDRQFDRLRHFYRRVLASLLDTWQVFVIMGLILLGGAVYLYMTSKSELSPAEDQGIVLAQILGPPNATPEQMGVYARQVFEIAHKLPEYSQMFQITGFPTVNQGIGGVIFKPWDERTKHADVLQQELQKEWAGIAGAAVAAFQFPALPGARGLPLQIVIKTTDSFDRLNEVSLAVLDKARTSGMFFFVDSDLKLDKPQIDDRRRPRPRRHAGPHAAGRRRRARRRAGRRLRQLLLDRRALVQGDPAGAAGRPPQFVAGARLPPAHAEWRAAAGIDGRPRNGLRGAGGHQPLPAAQLGDDPGRVRAVRLGKAGARLHEEDDRRNRAGRLPGRLRRHLAPVRPGVGRLRPDAAVRDRHRVPGALRAVRELSRSGGDPGLGPDGAVRGAGVHQPRVRHAQHLHAGRPGHADGTRQQARHPDRPVREPAAGRGPDQARRDRGGRGGAAAADPDDHGGDGSRRRAAGDRRRRGRRRAATRWGS